MLLEVIAPPSTICPSVFRCAFYFTGRVLPNCKFSPFWGNTYQIFMQWGGLYIVYIVGIPPSRPLWRAMI